MKKLLAHSKTKAVLRGFLAANFIAIGVAHFLGPQPFVAIMPPYLPLHLELVYLSGLFEILGGLGLVIPRVRKYAAWGLIALLIAVYPANIHMLVNEVYIEGLPKSKLMLWLRMPVQFVLMFLVAWSSELGRKRTDESQKISTS
jgi:uncharacterized membrane protein